MLIVDISAAITTLVPTAAIITWVKAIIAAIDGGTWLAAINWCAWLALIVGVRDALFDWDIDGLGDIFGVGLSWDNLEVWHLSGHFLTHHGSNWHTYGISFTCVDGSRCIWFIARNTVGEGLWDHFGHHFRLGHWHPSLWDNQWSAFNWGTLNWSALNWGTLNWGALNWSALNWGTLSWSTAAS